MKSNRGIVWSLIFIFFAALYIRLLNWHNVFHGNEITFFGHDPYYHMRRILLALKYFPFIPEYDYYINYPNGLTSHYGPLFDLIIATIIKLISPFSSSIHTVETTAAIFPAVMGALFIFIIYFIGRTLFDYRVGLISATTAAVMRILIFTSEIGRTDHHVAEIFFGGIGFLIIFYMLHSLTLLPSQRKILLCILGGSFLGLAILTSTVMMLFILIFVLYINIQFIINFFLKKDPDYLLTVGFFILFGCLIALIPSLLSFSKINLSFDFDRLTLFQPALLILSAMEFVFLSKPLKSLKGYRNYLKPKAIVLISLFSVIFFIVIYYIFSPIVHNIFRGWQYVSIQDEWLKSVSETQPLFLEYDPYRFRAHIIFHRAIGYLGRAFILIPIGFAFLAWMWIKEKKDGYLLFLVLSLSTGILSVYQRRFLNLFSISACILMAYVINEIYLKLLTIQWKRIPSFYPAVYIVLSILTFSFYPKGDVLLSSSSLGYQWLPGLNETLTWLKENTPQTSYFLERKKIPEYGILSVWELGHRIVYLSNRPIVANNLHNNKQGLKTVTEFIFASDPDKARQILEDNRIKYIITTSLDDGIQLFDYARFMQIDPIKYIQFKPKELGKGYEIQTSKKIEYYKLIFNRLHLLDGSNFDLMIPEGQTFRKERIEMLSNFRLIYESPYLVLSSGLLNQQVNNLKIFQYVTGARVNGHASPNEEVVARLPIKTNSGRTFLYKSIAKTDSEGNFIFVLPYSTEQTTPYEITSGSFKEYLRVSEEEIEKGLSKEFNLIN